MPPRSGTSQRLGFQKQFFNILFHKEMPSEPCICIVSCRHSFVPSTSSKATFWGVAVFSTMACSFLSEVSVDFLREQLEEVG